MPHAAYRIIAHHTVSHLARASCTPRLIEGTMKYIAGYEPEPDPKPRSAEKRDIGAYSSRVRLTGGRGFSGFVVS
jgi:hypothetical protein